MVSNLECEHLLQYSSMVNGLHCIECFIEPEDTVIHMNGEDIQNSHLPGQITTSWPKCRLFKFFFQLRYLWSLKRFEENKSGIHISLCLTLGFGDYDRTTISIINILTIKPKKQKIPLSRFSWNYLFFIWCPTLYLNFYKTFCKIHVFPQHNLRHVLSVAKSIYLSIFLFLLATWVVVIQLGMSRHPQACAIRDSAPYRLRLKPEAPLSFELTEMKLGEYTRYSILFQHYTTMNE